MFRFKCIVVLLFALGAQAFAQSEAYIYREMSAEAKKRFTEILPKEIQIFIAEKYPQYAYITSCKGNLLPHEGDEFAINVLSSDKKTNDSAVAYVGKDKKVVWTPVEFEIPLTLEASNDYVETYCIPASYFGNKLNSMDVKTYQMNGLHTYSYDEKTKKFKLANETYPD